MKSETSREVSFKEKQNITDFVRAIVKKRMSLLEKNYRRLDLLQDFLNGFPFQNAAFKLKV